jgi:cytoskeletal protein RodZ
VARAQERPRRHRRGIVILVGAWLAIVALGMGSIGLSAMTPGPSETADPSASIPVIAGGSGTPTASATASASATATPTATPSPTPTPTPTKKPTPKPTKKPTPKPTPTPGLFAAWQAGHVPASPPILAGTAGAPFYIQTISGAECRVQRIRTVPSSSTTRSSSWAPANSSGQLTINWTSYPWMSGSTYSVWAQCRKIGTTTPVATTTPVSVAIP